MTSNKQIQRGDHLQDLVGDRQMSTRTIRLTKERAVCWCRQLSEILADDSDAFPGIAEFRGLLEDASWLANWKREHATIEICRSSIPDLLNELLQVSETDLATERPSVCEEIVHTLGSDSDG